MLRPLRDALEGAPGRRLADIGGGTGNYALALRREGWEPTVVDRSAGMLARAGAKGLDTVEADAQEPPFEDESIHPPRASILAELPGARLVEFEFEDMEDGSLAALSADPERVLTAAERGATSPPTEGVRCLRVSGWLPVAWENGEDERHDRLAP